MLDASAGFLRAVRAGFLSALGLACLSIGGQAQQILETYNDSLTTYLAGATPVNHILPLPSQRGVNLDGSMRSGPGFAMAIAGNPSESAWVGQQSQGALRIDIGAYAPLDVDIAMPTTGLPWVVGRTHNPLQSTASDGPMGVCWQNTSMPEVVLFDGATDADDVLYLVYGADRFVEYRRTSDTNSTEFKGKNGAAGCFQYAANGSAADTYTLTDQVGNLFVFFGFDGASGVAAGQFWKMTDPAGNTAYVGDASTSSTAITNGYDATCGGIKLAYDASDHRFTYTYSTLNSKRRLTQVKAEVKDSGAWGGSPVNVRTAVQVDYDYYGTSDSNGGVGNLRKVTIATRLNDLTSETITQTKKMYYRYYTGSFDPTGPPANPGHSNTLKLVLDFEGARRFDWAGDATFDDDFLSASTDDLKAYSSAYLEYDSSKRVNLAFFQGQCGCSGGASGVHQYSFATNGSFSNTSGYDTEWKSRTVVQQPDGGYLTQYFDETNQGLARVLSDANPTSATHFWVTQAVRDSSGLVSEIDMPDSVSGYTHSSGAVTITAATSTSPLPGLVWKYLRTSSGNLTGFLLDRKFQQGSGASSAYYDSSGTWTTLSQTIGNVTVYRPLVASRSRYPAQSTSSSGAETTSFSYSDYTSDSKPLAVKKITTTQPMVSTTNNGPGGSALLAYAHITKEGKVDYEKDTAGRVTYRVFTDGLETSGTVDKTVGSGTGPGGDSDFESTGSPLDKTSTKTFSNMGFLKELSLDTGSVEPVLRSKLADERLVTIQYQDLGSGYYYGPGHLTVTNLAGKIEVTGTIAYAGDRTNAAQNVHVDETKSDPIQAVYSAGVQSLAQMSMTLYDATGREATEERAYFLIPSSGAGTAGTNYDSTLYAYDTLGRRWRTKEPSGTIRRTVFDMRGQVTESYIGTNDHSFSGGEVSGTDNMVKTEMLVYDGGSTGGNGLLTQETRYVEDSTTDQRITSYLYDPRGRCIVTLPPLSPFTLAKYDNLGRIVAVGQYSSSSGLDAGDDPTSLATNRLALSEIAYDELGRAWKMIRHQIDPTDGSDDATLDSATWYDAAGRVVKVNGGELRKTAYDRVGRVMDEFILAVDDDTSYSDALTVTGDIVLEQRQTRYDSSTGDLLMRAVISRWTTDISTGETTGVLDTNADAADLKLTTANLKGRTQITAYWYDRVHRQTTQALYGTNGGSDFDRSSISEPSTSADDRLLTKTAYNIDGTMDTSINPKDIVTKYFHDALGRTTKTIRNFNVGVNSGDPYGLDDNVTIAYAYANGLRATVTADLPSGCVDQVTNYTYGTTKGTSAGDSRIATGHLLQTIAYPDSAGSADTINYTYNAQGEVVSRADQGGNVLETTYDNRGRTTEKRLTAIGSGFDGAVRRIETQFDDLSQRNLITEYDDPAVGSGSALDEVGVAYDGWGNIISVRQDYNSKVGAMGSVDDYSIAYTWQTANTGRHTIRKSSETYPSGNVIGFVYSSASGRHDDEASRVTELTDGRTIVKYRYNGGEQVVLTGYPEPRAEWRRYGGSGTSGTLPDMDGFDRTVKSRWTKTLTTPIDFYHVELTYDRNSNITSVDDQVHAGFDVKYGVDDLDRLIDADEGTLASGSITSGTRREEWVLGHTGTWTEDKLDLNHDSDYVDTNEVHDCRTYDNANELTHHNTDCSGGNEIDLTYDDAGNVTDDGKEHKYVWDGFYRLRKVLNQSDDLVAEYRYNGLGYRIAELTDTNVDKTVDAGTGDVWFYDVYDDKWRQVARFRDADSAPKEEFIYHEAGYGGAGESSNIDELVLRYRDADTAWVDAGDGVLEETTYSCQNWRSDVSTLVDQNGEMREWTKYSAYGTPFGVPGGDTDSNGTCDSSDVAQIQSWITTPHYDVRGDLDLDGDVDAADKSIANSLPFIGQHQGRLILSGLCEMNRGMAGVQYSASADLILGRFREMRVENGEWLGRDILGYTDGMDLYQYTGSNPVRYVDPSSLASCTLVNAGTTEATNIGAGVVAGVPPQHLAMSSTPPYSYNQTNDDCSGCQGCLTVPKLNIGPDTPESKELWHPKGYPQWSVVPSSSGATTAGLEHPSAPFPSGSTGFSELRNLVVPISAGCGETKAVSIIATSKACLSCVTPFVARMFAFTCTKCGGGKSSGGVNESISSSVILSSGILSTINQVTSQIGTLGTSCSRSRTGEEQN